MTRTQRDQLINVVETIQQYDGNILADGTDCAALLRMLDNETTDAG